ncbi:type II secretion system protein GspC [Colwellia ponticola]|uniref:Type II secretion system protein GspC n=1 Tax=Colwellia ponticola TaxID=2304625 RepID=A0A8H2JPS6_9GAMM|nr:type II secretion system protein GspC [Colwellia ponticola]TMM47854.1 type II secretion system protein GspC [Colwellia ponticola]
MAFPTNMIAVTSLLTHCTHRRVAQVVMALLIVYIAYISAKITWSVIPATKTTDNSVVNNAYSKKINSKNSNKTIDVSKVQSLNLFGQFNEEADTSAKTEVVNAPETSLNLTLSGLVASDEQSIAAAIIEHRGKQETYGIGDIITGTRANLEQVLMDRVIIKHSGRLETLMLDGFDYNQPARGISNKSNTTTILNTVSAVASQSAGAEVIDQSNNKRLAVSAKELRNELVKSPANISDYLQISPKRQAGSIVGYTLRPGKKAQFFEQAGLKAGDVAVEMNGYDLIVPAQAMQAMAAMKQAGNISLLVDRQGSLTEILISVE